MDIELKYELCDIVKEEGYGQPVIEVKRELDSSYFDSREFIKEEPDLKQDFDDVPLLIKKEEEEEDDANDIPLIIKKEEEDDENDIYWDKSPINENSSEDDFSLIDLINSSYVSYESCDTPSVDSSQLLEYTCHHCCYSSKWKQKLRSHIITHHLTEVNSKWCVQCQKSFRKESSLKKHRDKNHRSGEKSHKCHLCSFVAKRGYNLKVHVENVHTNKRSFGCPHCLYSASRRDTLKRHIRSFHNGERPYSCPHCDFDATRSYTVKIHIKTVHKIKKLSIQCSECTCTTTTKGALARHMKLKHNKCGPKN